MASQPEQQITTVLQAVHRGDEGATQSLFALVYDELRRTARAREPSERAAYLQQACGSNGALRHGARAAEAGFTTFPPPA